MTPPRPRRSAFLLRVFSAAGWLVVLFGPAFAADQPVAGLSTRIDQAVSEIYHGPPVPLADDVEFLRRIYLDLVGRGPTVEENQAFFGAIAAGVPAAEVREALIDDLLSSEEFSHYFAKVLEVIFTERRELISTLEFRAFIRTWLKEERPLNELFLEVLAADGTGELWRPAASFVVNRKADPHLVTRDIGRIYFGRDVQCAQCHDHPLITDYEQSEYFGILAFVNRTYLFEDANRGNMPLLGEKADGSPEFTSVFRPEDGTQAAQLVLPMGMAMDAEPGFANSAEAYVVAPDDKNRGIPLYSRRQQLAVLATHPENTAFNRNLANRLWAVMMGRGVVHPVDLHHDDNPAVSAALLRVLADELVACGYDLRAFLRQIARSSTYQRSSHMPSLNDWGGPEGGVEMIEACLAEIDSRSALHDVEDARLEEELSTAAKQLDGAQRAVATLQRQIDEASTQLQSLTSEKNAAVAALDSHASAESADEVADSLRNAVEEVSRREDDQRTRVVALTNRRLALSEFVVEARGVQRRVRSRVQAFNDARSDDAQQSRRLGQLRDWLVLRENGKACDTQAEISRAQPEELEQVQAALVASWVRAFAVHRVRGLTPEQLAGAIYTSLEMGRPVREQAMRDWDASHHVGDPDREDERKRSAFVTSALASNQWDTVEDLVVDRFAAPQGAPQDGFFATVDQALAIQNDPTFHSWLKPANGNLIERLLALESDEDVAQQLYLGILGRAAVGEEVATVLEMLSQFRDERSTIIQELTWGLIASTEFRFTR